MTNAWREVLLAAADYMGKHGKCSGRFQDSHGRVCAVGAIGMIAIGEPVVPLLGPGNEAYLRLSATLRIADAAAIVTWWSDHNSKKTVVSTMRKVAKGG